MQIAWAIHSRVEGEGDAECEKHYMHIFAVRMLASNYKAGFYVLVKYTELFSLPHIIAYDLSKKVISLEEHLRKANVMVDTME